MACIKGNSPLTPKSNKIKRQNQSNWFVATLNTLFIECQTLSKSNLQIVSSLMVDVHVEQKIRTTPQQKQTKCHSIDT